MNRFQEWITDQGDTAFKADKKAGKRLNTSLHTIKSYRIGRRQPTIKNAKLHMKKLKGLRLEDFY